MKRARTMIVVTCAAALTMSAHAQQVPTCRAAMQAAASFERTDPPRPSRAVDSVVAEFTGRLPMGIRSGVLRQSGAFASELTVRLRSTTEDTGGDSLLAEGLASLILNPTYPEDQSWVAVLAFRDLHLPEDAIVRAVASSGTTQAARLRAVFALDPRVLGGADVALIAAMCVVNLEPLAIERTLGFDTAVSTMSVDVVDYVVATEIGWRLAALPPERRPRFSRYSDMSAGLGSVIRRHTPIIW